jgi:hypothetical protein
VNPKYGQSNYFMPLKYHGDGEVEAADIDTFMLWVTAHLYLTLQVIQHGPKA